MTETMRGPREVMADLLHSSVDGEWDKFVELYTDDAVIEMPFAPPGVPRVSDGAALRTRILGMAQNRPWTFQRAENVVLHETTDPEVVVFEYELHGTVTATTEPLALSFIMVVTVRDGKIVHSRDYANPLATAKLLDRLPELVEAYRNEGAQA
ncbi:MAG TPA: nuclear transport factor 2 family protein [Pseudonocardiaceae bacterium]|jgi:ketosteroid isomerase-like protein|nr:nuclear transport factor 2 family protein [Pseudonocardiaceae bacterium]